MDNWSGMTHNERMALAQQLAQKILARYGNGVLAVFVTSSTAKGLDQRHSDLELTAVVQDGVTLEGKSYVHGGILIEIEYPQESAILKTARSVTRRWPLVADSYRVRRVLFERTGWMRRLDEAIAEQDAADFTKAWHFAMTELIENRDKLRNAWLAKDALNIRVTGVSVAHSAVLLVLFLNHRYMTTTRQLFKEAFECPVQPPEFRSQIEQLVGVTLVPLDQLVECAERLTIDLLEIGRTQGIAVDSPELIV